MEFFRNNFTVVSLGCSLSADPNIRDLLQGRSQIAAEWLQALQTLFTGLIMSKITYALQSFAGQLTADDRNRIGAISRKAQRHGVSCMEFDIYDLIDTVDRKLFAHITDPNHCLHHLLPPTAHRSYSLRKRQHG